MANEKNVFLMIMQLLNFRDVERLLHSRIRYKMEEKMKTKIKRNIATFGQWTYSELRIR